MVSKVGLTLCLDKRYDTEIRKRIVAFVGDIITMLIDWINYRHLKKHTNEQYVKVEELSQPQLIMQQFRNFDLDKNGKIDGLELLKAAAQMNGNQTNLLFQNISFNWPH